jgi:acetate kinase
MMDAPSGASDARATMTILSLNTGSATVKYGLFDPATLGPLGSGRATGIGTAEGHIEHARPGGDSVEYAASLPDHGTAVEAVLHDIASHHGGLDTITAVGHRVVHGGTELSAPTAIDDAVVTTIRELGRLAPLHNALAADAIDIARARLPQTPHIALFDTAFHAQMPSHACRYAIPERYAEDGYRRYGFHGISHQSAAAYAADWLGRPLEQLRLITLHLGSGASAAAIEGGMSIDTSMGMTPLEGLVMGTRSGDIDPAAVLRMAAEPGNSIAAVETMLTRESGLRALAGTDDMRRIEARAADGDIQAHEALALFCYRIRKYIGAYIAALGGVDAIVYTGGIGENSATVRAHACHGLASFGIAIDEAANQAGELAIHAGTVPVLVVPADEEAAMARAVARLLAGDE